MRGWIQSFVKFMKKEDGPTGVEYAIMLALVIVICVGAISILGSNANTTFGNVSARTKGAAS